jgi:ketosteroid isomerase-like protein
VGFPDISCTVYDLLVEGNKAAWRVRATGTHTGDFPGIPPTGRRVDFDSMDFGTADSTGRPLDHTVMMDQATMLAQLGITAPGASGTQGGATPGGNAAVVRSGYDAFANQDIPSVLAILDSDVIWHTPDSMRTDPPLGGVFRGPDEVLQFFGRLPKFFPELAVSPEAYHEAGDTVLVQGHHRGRGLHGPAIDAPFAHVWTLRDGKAVSFREYTDTAVLAQAAGVSPDEIRTADKPIAGG